MTDADIDTMRELISEDMIYTHMSGMQQTREEYFSDISDGSLRYYTIGIADPIIEVDQAKARITYTSVLNANAYGSRGTVRINTNVYASFFYFENLLTLRQKVIIIHIDTKSE